MAEIQRSPRLVWCAVGVMIVLSVVGAAGSLWVSAVDEGPISETLLSTAVVLAFSIVGAVVVFSRPRNRIGWLLLLGGALWAMGNGALDVAYHGIVADPGAVAGASMWALGGGVLRGVGWYAVILGLPTYFPTGHLAGPRWRWLPRLVGVVMVASVADTLLAPDANLRLLNWENPLALPSSLRFVDDLAFLASVPLALVVAVAAVVQLLERWKRGRGVERQQLTLFAAAAFLPALAGPVSFVPGAPGWLFSAAALPLPFAIGYAVLARGLYDLRAAANRSLVWLTLSIVVAGLYAGSIYGVEHLLGDGRTRWATIVAVVVVAVSVVPLRDVLQRGVNRLTFGRWDEPYEVLASLGQLLEATSDVERLLSNVVGELSALGLEGVRIEDADGETLASSGDAAIDPGATTDMNLSAYGERVGTLVFRPPTSPLRSRDRRLLDDLAGHLGGVLHDRRLTRDLQRAMERLVMAREEERLRLRRDLHDGLGPALAGHLLRLDVVAREIGASSAAGQHIAALQDDIRCTVLDVRRVVEGLRPPALDELGLAGALDQASQRLSAGANVRVRVEVADLPVLPAATEVAVFRIATEAVNNVVRHADATHCRVVLHVSDGRLRLVIDDDGRGIDPDPSSRIGNGLQTMRERAEEMRGKLRIASSGGTTVTAELPLPPTPATQPESSTVGRT